MNDKLIEEIVMMLTSCNVNIDIQAIQQELYILFNKYSVSLKETALTVWKEDENTNLLRKFIIAKTVKGCSERTIQTYSNEIKRILATIGKNITEITTDDIRYYLAVRQKRDNVTKTTANNELRYLGSLFTFLHTEEYITRNPTAKIEKIKETKKKKHTFSEMEIEQIRNACTNEMDKAIVEVLLSTGMRVSELTSVQISDIENDSIYVKGKGDKYRRVYLNAKAIISIKNFLEKRKDINPYLFPGGDSAILKRGRGISRSEQLRWYETEELVHKDKALETSSVECRIRKIGKLAGVEKCHPHRFRRTCATMALKRGMPIEQVSKMLGHEQIGTTQIYLDLSEDDLKMAHKKYVI